MSNPVDDSTAPKHRGRRRLLKQLAVLTAGVALLKTELVFAAKHLVQNVRLWRSPDKTRIVFEVSGDVSHKNFTLPNPERVVLDIKNTQITPLPEPLDLAGTPIAKVRFGIRNQHDTRVVLDMKSPVSTKAFVLQPFGTYGHRLVLDLFDSAEAAKPVVTAASATKPKKSEAVIKEKTVTRYRDIVIAIDAGHGGEDPGAIAHGGGYEKTVVLAIAKQLAALVNKEPGFKAVLIRSGDYFLPLRARFAKARKHGADLFVSIHADGFKDRRAKGAAVFVLSKSGASSETARWIAEKENSSDLIGGADGVSLSDKDDMLASVLMDLSMDSTIKSSSEVGLRVLRSMGNINKLHQDYVQRAEFAVLKSPDVPSILVETGFITNPEESRKLKSARHQRAMAGAIFEGIRTWFYLKPKDDTLVSLWKQQGKIKVLPESYKVRPGDTLSQIAADFGMSTDALRKANRIARAGHIRVGQTLIIPNS